MAGKAVQVQDERFERVTKEDGPIHWSVRFGSKVRVGENVVIDEGCSIGDGVFIGHNTVIRENVHIGAGSVIGHLVMIERDTRIGQRVTVQSQCHITAMARIDDGVFVGPMAMLINTRRISHGRGFAPELEGPAVGFAARLGAGSIVLPGRAVGENAVVGAGSLLVRDIPPRQIWYGAPASYHGEVPSTEIVVRGGPA
jgi:acetyltransferase-like isoleucine patch superfamily enzyme